MEIITVGKPSLLAVLVDLDRRHVCLVTPRVGSNCLDTALARLFQDESKTFYLAGDDLLIYNPGVGFAVIDTANLTS